MGYIRITCAHCRKRWVVYNRNMNEDSARFCPRCLKAIDSQTWVRFILPAFGLMDDANRELVRDNLNTSPLFKVEYRI